MKLLLKLISLIIVVLLSNCATIPMASTDLDREAKKFSASPTESNIYLVRGMGVGFSISFQVALDGKTIGSIVPNTYHKFSVDPGNHSISVISNENNDFLNVLTEGGKNYYLEVVPMMGMVSARAKLKQIPEDQARKKIMGAKLAASMKY